MTWFRPIHLRLNWKIGNYKQGAVIIKQTKKLYSTCLQGELEALIKLSNIKFGSWYHRF